MSQVEGNRYCIASLDILPERQMQHLTLCIW